LANYPEIREQIILLAGRRERRFVPRDLPCNWTPTQVTNPAAMGICFTDISAWNFIVEAAESGCPIEEITLDVPKGEKGYVMKIKLEENVPEVYIKVQFKNNNILGRSFHYSTI
jgi:hypothetical protein